MKILHLEYSQYPAAAIDELQQHELVQFDCVTQQELVLFLKENSFDAIFTRLGLMIDEEVLALQPQLKYIITPTTGLNHIDCDAAHARNIAVVSLKGETEFLATIKSTAEHTWTLLLAVTRKLVAAHNAVATQGKWERKPFQAGEVDGKTIGIIGYGRLGKIVAKYATAFGMKVLVNDNDSSREAEATNDVMAVTLDQLLHQSDYVVLLISWSKENNGFFKRAMFDKMKPGAFFINTSRGELVEQELILENLNNGKLAGAALDVLDGDSAWETDVQGSEALLSYARENNNLLLTPHMGGYGTDSIGRTRAFITEKFLRTKNTIDS